MNNKDTEALLPGERKEELYVQNDQEISSDTDQDNGAKNGPEAKEVSTASDFDHFKLPRKRKVTLVSFIFIAVVVNQVTQNFIRFVRTL